MDLKSFREDKLKLTQAQFAELLEVEQSQISRWEKNPESISLAVIQKILPKTGVTYEELTGYEKPIPAPLVPDNSWRDAEFTKNTLSEYIDAELEKYNISEEQRNAYVDDLRKGILTSIVKPKITIVGRSDTGKSTMINALLGVEKMPTSWTPTTTIAVYIKHISDKPDFIEEDVWVFSSCVDDDCFWDEKRLYEENYCRKWKIGAGGVEVLRTFGTRQGEYYEKNAGAAVMFIDAPILNTCDIVDLPGFGTDTESDDRITFQATQRADVIIYLSQANGFMRIEDITYLKRNISELPIWEKKGENDLKLLSNLFIVASQAHIINNGNNEQLNTILDTGCENLMKTLSDGYWNNRTKISGYDSVGYLKEELRSRFFVYTTDISELCTHFNDELTTVLETLPSIINERAIKFVRSYIKTHKPILIAEMEKYEGIVNERKKYESLIKEIDTNELERKKDNSKRKKEIYDQIKCLKADSVDEFSDYCSKTINTDSLVLLLKERKVKAKKEDVEQFCSWLQSTIQEHLESILNNKSKSLSQNIENYVNEYSKNVSKNFEKIGIKPDFDVRLTFVSLLSKFGIISGFGISFAGMAAFIINNYTIIAALLGSAQFLSKPLLAFPPLIGIGILIGILSAVALSVIKANSIWERKIAKKIMSEYDKNDIISKSRIEIKSYWDETLKMFHDAAIRLDEEWASYVKNLREIVDSYDLDEIQRKIDSLKNLSYFFDNIPL